MKRPRGGIIALDSLGSAGGPIPYMWACATCGILCTAFFMRTFHLMTAFPILVDESIYLRWAEIIQHQHNWFISLLDAKQPLTYWLYAVLRAIWPRDPLLSARFASALLGVVSAFGVYSIAKEICGRMAANISTLLYSVFPYAIFYDRLAYTEAFVNCFAIWIVYTSLVHFRSTSFRYDRAMTVGLCLGLGFFCKTTIAQLAFFPAAACILLNPSRWRSLLLIYGSASIFPVISLVSLPAGPTFPGNHWLLHQTPYFTPLSTLILHPTINLSRNLFFLLSYARAYLTIPALVTVGLSLIVTLGQVEYWLLLTVTLVPLCLQIMVLRFFPSRYAFPHMWPLLIVAGCAIEVFSRRPRRRWIALSLASLIMLPMAITSVGFLRNPVFYLCPSDVQQFLGSNAYVGYGVDSAVAFLRQQSQFGALTVLTDPFWGTPADAIFAYLNQTNGIDVHEAWWIELSDDYPLMPKGAVALMKSHYERVYGGSIDFSTRNRVFYITDSQYFSAKEVEAREFGAKLVASFPKPGGLDAIDIYSLK